MEDINKEELEITQEPKLYKVLGVMFEVTKKRYYFEVIDGVEYKKGDKVIVDTVRGKEIGLVYGEARMIPETELVLPLKPVIKRASKEEEERYIQLKADSLEAKNICKERDDARVYRSRFSYFSSLSRGCTVRRPSFRKERNERKRVF